MTWALIMAGGQGTRLWPLSCKKNPKQFLTLYGKKSLIENTVVRVSRLISQKHILIITDSKNVSRVRKLFPRIPNDQIIGEPIGRNTAATIGLAAALIQAKDPKSVLCVFPSDHVILNLSEFKNSLRQAILWASSGNHHVLFGTKPTFPSTAYGYVQCQKSGVQKDLFVVKKYIEKPNHTKAEKLFKKKDFFWQAGIFVFKVDTILKSLRKFLPRHYDAVIKIAKARSGKGGFPLARLFAQLTPISIDYGIMEKLDMIYMVRARFDWNDIGSWNALESVWQKDKQRNAFLGNVIAHEAGKNLVYSPKRLIALLGVQNLVVIDSGDSVLVCSKTHAEKVKNLLFLLKQKLA